MVSGVPGQTDDMTSALLKKGKEINKEQQKSNNEDSGGDNTNQSSSESNEESEFVDSKGEISIHPYVVGA